VETKDGRTTHLDLGGNGRAVLGKIAIPSEALEQVDWKHAEGILSLELEDPAVPPGLSPDERMAWARVWDASEAGRKQASQERSYQFSVERDGAFRIDDVPPGRYRMTVRIRRKGDENNMALGYARTNVTLPLEPGSGDAGLALAIGAVPFEIEEKDFVRGEPAPDFEVAGLDGKVIRSESFRGKVVVLQFWKASNYDMLREVQPLRELQETFGADKRFLIVSLAMNEERKDLEQFAAQNSLPWPQAYVGECGKGAIPKAYRVRGWPSVFLIGPDGNFIEPVAQATALKAKIAKALEQ
jgi:hypothetical protein